MGGGGTTASGKKAASGRAVWGDITSVPRTCTEGWLWWGRGNSQWGPALTRDAV